jgi:S-formylglutathione hydrolase FrmB
MRVVPIELPRYLIIAAIVTVLNSANSAVVGQETNKEETASQELVRDSFNWVNPPSAAQSHPRLTHETFISPSMGISVGYNIYLPTVYEEDSNRNVSYPVIYYLHGGRPGNESRSIGFVGDIHEAIESEKIRPVIFIWVNGGEVSHYNYGNSRGEDVFIQELIPYIDRTYRTIDQRGGRALQGFSQGGRGATRIMFKYPELFISAAPGGPGYGMEKQIFENSGIEQDTRFGRTGPALDFGEGNDAFSLAREYVVQPTQPPLSILVWVGTNGFNYDVTLEYLDYLSELEISAERLVVPGVGHNPIELYEKRGTDLLGFHDQHWSDVE